MKVFKICVSLSVMLTGLEIFRKILIGQTDYIVEPKHIILMVISLVVTGLSCWFWVNDN